MYILEGKIKNNSIKRERRTKLNSAIKNWFPLYVVAWITSEELQACHLFSKGILIELMVRSWYKKTPGKLQINTKTLSRILHCEEDEFISGLKELMEFGVITFSDNYVEIPKLIEVAQEQAVKHDRRVNASKAGRTK